MMVVVWSGTNELRESYSVSMFNRRGRESFVRRSSAKN